MKSSKYNEELRTKSVEELSEELTSAKKELFNLRFQNATNQLDNTARPARRLLTEREDNRSWKKEI